MKVCNNCKLEKDLVHFYNDKRSKDGKCSWCKFCRKQYNKNPKVRARQNSLRNTRRKNNPDKYRSKERDWWRNNPKNHLFTQAKARAKRKNIEFNLDINDILIPNICPILEIPFEVGIKNSYKYTYSLDRIDNTKGYIKGNVRVISSLANSMKNSATKKQLITFHKNILQYLQIDDIVQS